MKACLLNIGFPLDFRKTDREQIEPPLSGQARPPVLAQLQSNPLSLNSFQPFLLNVQCAQDAEISD